MFVRQSGVTDLTTMLPPSVSWTANGGTGPAGAAERMRRLICTETP
jgi:hypothetical protein